MSIQAGIWNFDGQPVDRDYFSGISQALIEFGPDGEAVHLIGSVGMLYRPHHTTAESRLERQPHTCSSGALIMWDGRLDNPEELVSLLSGGSKDYPTDVSIVAAAFEKWGSDAFAKFVGDWAMTVWSPRNQSLILARDYIGVRQLFYYPTSNGVSWCTNLAQLALRGLNLTLSEEYVAGYLALYADPHLTPYREIHAVPPGQFVSFYGRAIKVNAYWQFSGRSKTRYTSNREYEEHFRYLFRQAVHRRLRSDSPILADLSGGFDSSSIVCMADAIAAQAGSNVPTVDTCSLYDSHESELDDPVYFTEVEKRRGKTGIHVDLGAFPVSFNITSSEFVATPGLGEREELKAARSKFKHPPYHVTLSGMGGDEMLAQCLDPRVQIADLVLDFRLLEAAKKLTEWSLLIRRPWIQLFGQTCRLLLPVQLRALMTESAKPAAWINLEFARRLRIPERMLGHRGSAWFWRVTPRDWFHTLTALSGQLAYVRPSLSEKRYPFLDQTLVEFLTSIPTDQLLRPGERRFLMRRALSEVLPPQILSRRSKGSAGRCYATTIEKHWTELETILCSPFSSTLGFFNQTAFYEALSDMRNGKFQSDFISLLRALAMELWLRDVVGRGVLSLPNVSECVEHYRNGDAVLGDPNSVKSNEEVSHDTPVTTG